MNGTTTPKLNGIYALCFACEDRDFRTRQLERFGFRNITPSIVRRSSNMTALQWGNIPILLLDPESSYHAADVRRVLRECGDMQLFSAVIAVENLSDAARVFGAPVIRRRVPYSFEQAPMATVQPYPIATTAWEFVEALDLLTVQGEPTIDHFAIAVSDLQSARVFYEQLGFAIVFDPKKPIAGDYSAMETTALSYGDGDSWRWTVALVQGVDQQRSSQVSNYLRDHGVHAVQHAAVRCVDLPELLHELYNRGVRFRTRVDKPSKNFVLEEYLHLGRDHSGPLKQCFTKPFTPGGFFFELIERISEAEYEEAVASFDMKTVIGLYRSIEHEEIANDTTLIVEE